MNTLMQEGLFTLMAQAARNPRTPIEAAAYEAAFEAFVLEAARMTDASCTPRVLRTIERARMEAAGLLRLFSGRESDARWRGTTASKFSTRSMRSGVCFCYGCGIRPLRSRKLRPIARRCS